MNARVTIACLLTALGGAVTAAAGVAQGAPRGTVSVIATVPAPGNPALPLVTGGDIWEGTYSSAAGSSAPSKVFEFSAAGALLKSYTISGQELDETHGIQVAATDARGDLVLLDDTSGRVLLMNRATGATKLYSTIPELPVCGKGGSTECSQESQAQTPEPDYAAWGPSGELYITDYQQGVIWRVPPHGGIPSIWLQAPELDGGMFGTAGLVMEKDHRTLLFDQASTLGSTGLMVTGGLYSVAIEPDGEPGPLHLLWTSAPGALPDGFALTSSGDVYMAQIGPTANDVIELSPSGALLQTFGTPVTGANGSAIPFDEPSGVAFLGSELVVANQAYLDGEADHMALLGIATGEQGAPVYVPASAGPKPAPARRRPVHRRRRRPAKRRHGRAKSRHGSAKRHGGRTPTHR